MPTHQRQRSIGQCLVNLIALAQPTADLAAASAVNRLPLEPSRKVGEPPRISTTAWFVRKHDEVRAEVWRRPSVGSPANCLACHSGAEKGDFDEDRVKIPR